MFCFVYEYGSTPGLFARTPGLTRFWKELTNKATRTGKENMVGKEGGEGIFFLFKSCIRLFKGTKNSHAAVSYGVNKTYNKTTNKRKP